LNFCHSYKYKENPCFYEEVKLLDFKRLGRTVVLPSAAAMAGFFKKGGCLSLELPGSLMVALSFFLNLNQNQN